MRGAAGFFRFAVGAARRLPLARAATFATGAFILGSGGGAASADAPSAMCVYTHPRPHSAPAAYLHSISPLTRARTLSIPLKRPADSNMIIFSGNANPELASEIASALDSALGRIVVSRFADGEVNCQVRYSRTDAPPPPPSACTLTEYSHTLVRPTLRSVQRAPLRRCSAPSSRCSTMCEERMFLSCSPPAHP